MDLIFNPKLSVPLRSPVPGVFVLHGPEHFVVPSAYDPVDRLQAHILMPRYVRSAAAVILSTEDAKAMTCKLIANAPEKIHVSRPAVDARFTKAVTDDQITATRAKYGLPDRFMLFVGGLHRIKNFGRIAEALAALRSRLHRRRPAGRQSALAILWRTEIRRPRLTPLDRSCIRCPSVVKRSRRRTVAAVSRSKARDRSDGWPMELTPKIPSARLLAVKMMRTLGVNKVAHRIYYEYLHRFDTANRYALPAIEQCLRRLGESGPGRSGDYMEFGIFKGYAFWHAQRIARESRLDSMRFFGFDSFAGLPAPKGVDATPDETFYQGQYACKKATVEHNLNARGVDWDRTFLIEGFFADA